MIHICLIQLQVNWTGTFIGFSGKSTHDVFWFKFGKRCFWSSWYFSKGLSLNMITEVGAIYQNIHHSYRGLKYTILVISKDTSVRLTYWPDGIITWLSWLDGKCIDQLNTTELADDLWCRADLAMIPAYIRNIC